MRPSWIYGPRDRVTIPRVIPALLENLKSKDKGLRLIAMRALETIGTEAKEAIPALTETLKDSEPEVAISASLFL